jgi:hypothetical protein
MAATLESVQSLLLQVLAEGRAQREENKALREEVASLKAQLTANQVAQASSTARKTRSSTTTSTHIGTDATTGQASQAPKFPSNTVLWVKDKAANDPNFLPQKMTPGNYNSMEAKHADKLKDITSESDRRKRLAEIIWKELNELAEKSIHAETKEFATKLIEHLRKEWKDEKLAHEAQHPKAAPQATSGVLVPDLAVMNAPAMTLTAPADQFSLVTPLNLSLSLVSPVTLPTH